MRPIEQRIMRVTPLARTSVAVLAGGMATRLRPLTDDCPKSLLEVAGEPFVVHQLRLLRAAGIHHAVLCTGHMGEQIREVVGSGARFGLDVRYSWDGERPLGTAGALKHALHILSDPFLVLYGDSYLPCNYGAVLQAHSSAGKKALMTLFHNVGRIEPSNVEFDGSHIISYSKTDRTQRMEHMDYGLGVLSHSALETIEPGQFHDLAALYGALLNYGELAACEMAERFYEIGSPSGLEETDRYLTTCAEG